MSINTRAGRLRHRVTQQREEEVPDGGGGYVVDWVDYPEGLDDNGNKKAEFWASVEPTVGRESLEARQLEDAITHKIVCRGPRDIKAADRIVHDGRAFNIRSVKDIQERGHRIEIEAEEGVAV